MILRITLMRGIPSVTLTVPLASQTISKFFLSTSCGPITLCVYSDSSVRLRSPMPPIEDDDAPAPPVVSRCVTALSWSDRARCVQLKTPQAEASWINATRWEVGFTRCVKSCIFQ